MLDHSRSPRAEQRAPSCALGIVALSEADLEAFGRALNAVCGDRETADEEAERLLAMLDEPRADDDFYGKVVEPSSWLLAFKNGEISLYEFATGKRGVEEGTSVVAHLPPATTTKTFITHSDIDPTGNGYTSPVSRERRDGLLAPWKTQTAIGRLLNAHNGLLSMGRRVMSFSLNIRHDRWERALASGAVDRFFALELQRHLKLVGLPWSFWFAFEISPNGTPHMHGAAIVEEGTDAIFRECCRKAVGEWETCRQFQADTDERADFGWVRYATEELGEHGILGRGYYVTRDVLQLAKSSYNEKRDAQLAALKSKATPAKEEKQVITDEFSVEIDINYDFRHDSVTADLPDNREDTNDAADFHDGVLRPLSRAARRSTDRATRRLRPHRLSPTLPPMHHGARWRAHRLSGTGPPGPCARLARAPP